MNTDQVNDLNVLVVDGNTVNTMLLTRTLQLFHFKAQICSGKDTVKNIRRNNYDIAFIYHKLPDMSGTEITEAIRKLRRNKKNIIIYILTDSATEEIRELYRASGANLVLEQPLKMETFLMDLKQYFPQLNLFISAELKKHSCRDTYEWCKIKTAFYAVKEINLEAGVKNSLGNHVLFIQIIRSALKDMTAFLNIINSEDKISIEEFKKELHNLKGVLPYIGADNIAEDTRRLEADLKLGYYMAAIDRLKDYIRDLKVLQEDLRKALENYNMLMELIGKDMSEGIVNEELQSNRMDGYEQCIRKAIYYINRYEYDHILQELDQLTRIDEEHLVTYQKVTDSIKEFDYEEALKLLIGLEYWKNKKPDQ
jgi:CheY-like chemotaxis protein